MDAIKHEHEGRLGTVYDRVYIGCPICEADQKLIAALERRYGGAGAETHAAIRRLRPDAVGCCIRPAGADVELEDGSWIRLDQPEIETAIREIAMELAR